MGNPRRHRTWMIAFALAAGCGHQLDPGPYALTATAIRKDPCGLAPDGGSLWDGDLAISGEDVNLAYALNDLRLVGQFKADVVGEPEAFTADGTGAQVQAQLGNLACAADFVQVHLDAQVDAKTRFSGELKIHYDMVASPPNPAACPISCDLDASFQANRKMSSQ